MMMQRQREEQAALIHHHHQSHAAQKPPQQVPVTLEDMISIETRLTELSKINEEIIEENQVLQRHNDKLHYKGKQYKKKFKSLETDFVELQEHLKSSREREAKIIETKNKEKEDCVQTLDV
jgi:hypothetical protein